MKPTGLATDKQHFHVWVSVATAKAELVTHNHTHAGPPHTHTDDAHVSVTSVSMYDRAMARIALKEFKRRIGE